LGKVVNIAQFIDVGKVVLNSDLVRCGCYINGKLSNIEH
jgi:hypothetical protein